MVEELIKREDFLAVVKSIAWTLSMQENAFPGWGPTYAEIWRHKGMGYVLDAVAGPILMEGGGSCQGVRLRCYRDDF